MKQNETFIKLYRKFTEWEWYTDVPTKVLFIHILLRASATGKKYRGVDIPKGSFTTSVGILADETGLSNQQIRTALKKLQSTNEICVKSTNKFSQITVIKWADYQGYMAEDNKQITNNQQTNNKQITTIKESKESKEYINISKKKNKKEKGFNPPTITEVRTYCIEIDSPIDPEEFYDYYQKENWPLDKHGNFDWKYKIRQWTRNYRKDNKTRVYILDPTHHTRDEIEEYTKAYETQNHEPQKNSDGEVHYY